MDILRPVLRTSLLMLLAIGDYAGAAPLLLKTRTCCNEQHA